MLSVSSSASTEGLGELFSHPEVKLGHLWGHLGKLASNPQTRSQAPQAQHRLVHRHGPML